MSADGENGEGFAGSGSGGSIYIETTSNNFEDILGSPFIISAVCTVSNSS